MNRPRGLCWGCYYAPGVRELYPYIDCNGSRRGIGTGVKFTPPPPTPTAFLPGTPEKVAVMMERAEGGYQINHPKDARHQ